LSGLLTTQFIKGNICKQGTDRTSSRLNQVAT